MKNQLLFSFWVLSLASFCFGVSCTKKTSVLDSKTESAPVSADQLEARGKAIYLSNCIACHDTDPSKDGSVGPAIAGSSLELLEARILKAGYPIGYQPKRQTGQMQALPHLKNEIPALHSYLNSTEVLNAH